MLSYAFTALNQGGYEDVAAEEFENMHNLFAAILAKGIGRQLKPVSYTHLDVYKRQGCIRASPLQTCRSPSPGIRQ